MPTVTASHTTPSPKAGPITFVPPPSPPESRTVEATAYLWATGGGDLIYGQNQTNIQIVPDKKTYQPGDTAKILVITSIPNAKVLFTREGRSLGEVKVVESTGTSFTAELPIREEDEPDCFVSAVFVKDNRVYQGTKRLSVPPKDKKLSVNVITSKVQYRPGETGQFTVEARDSAGKPVVGEFSVGVVDEAIYGVRPDTTQKHRRKFLRRWLQHHLH